MGKKNRKSNPPVNVSCSRSYPVYESILFTFLSCSRVYPAHESILLTCLSFSRSHYLDKYPPVARTVVMVDHNDLLPRTQQNFAAGNGNRNTRPHHGGTDV